MTGVPVLELIGCPASESVIDECVVAAAAADAAASMGGCWPACLGVYTFQSSVFSH